METRLQRLLAWVSAHTLAALTLIGLLAYGVIQLAYVQFYGRLGVDPDEVGLDYVHTLSQSVPTLAAILASFALLAGFAILGIGVLVDGVKAVTNWHRRRSGKPKRGASHDSRSFSSPKITWRAWAIILLALGLAATSANVYFALGPLADRVERGDAVHATRIGDAEGRNPLSFSAEPVGLIPVGEAVTAVARLADHRLMYLGSAEGIHVFYDSDCKRVIRLPDSEVIIVQSDPDVRAARRDSEVNCAAIFRSSE